MKIFVVKTIIVALAFYVVFEFTIGMKIKDTQEVFLKYKNKTERIKIKEKLFSEIQKANQKEKIFSEKDRKILSKFILKISKELDLSK
tara:strand:- start:90 stop:353 length:264 start_codon:yes stop_codon:yes gene_type:complete